MDEFCRDVEHENLAIQRSSSPEVTYLASVEIFIVPALAIWLFSGYFRGFLQEAGKDHYQILKKSLKKLWSPWVNNENEIKIALLSASGEKKTEYSLRFALYAEIRNNRRVKLLFANACTKEEFELSIESFLHLIESYQLEEESDSNLEIDLDAEKDYAGHVFVAFDSQTGALRVVSPIPSHVRNP